MSSSHSRSVAEIAPETPISAPPKPAPFTLLTPWRLRVIAGAVTLLLLLIPLLEGLRKGGSPLDEGIVLVYPELVLKGAVPYRDFESVYGPANTYLLAGVYALLGAHVDVERGVGLAYRLVILLALFGLLQRWSTGLAVSGTLMAGIVLLPTGATAFAWMGAMASGLGALWCGARPESRARCFGGGLLAVTALLFRPDLGLAVIASAIPLLFLMPAPSRKAYLLAAGLALLPLLALAIGAGPRQVFENLFLYPVFYTSAGRRLPFSVWPHYLTLALALHAAACALHLLAGILAVREARRSPEARLLLSLALFALGLSHQALQRVDRVHVAFTVFLSFALLPVSLAVLLSRFTGWRPAQWRTLACSGLLAFGAAGALVTPLFVLAQREFWRGVTAAPPLAARLEYRDRSFPLDSLAQVVTAGPILDVLGKYGQPGERLFVGPGDLRRTWANDTEIYHLLPQFVPATYFLEMNPLSANRPHSRLAADIASADWLILNRLWDSYTEPNASAWLGSNEPNEVVQAHFERIARHGTFELYRRKRAAGW